jgi:hypothetical protein
VTGRSVLASLVVVLIGSAAAAGAFWTLLNVPESNVLALAASAFLLLLTAFIAAVTLSIALEAAAGVSLSAAARRALRGVQGFLVGFVLFAALWWITTSIDNLWALHRGEIDALMLRYAGTANTRWIHTSAAWFLWLVRWGVGLAVVCATTAGAMQQAGAVRGVSTAFSLVPLGAMLAALVAGRGLWWVANWRPQRLIGTSSEFVFVSTKLTLLALAASLLAAFVLHAFALRGPAEAGHYD